MSRLIDADKLLADLKESDLVTFSQCIDFIVNYPTAFDKDKVIEELEAHWFLGGWSVEHQGKSGTYYTDDEGEVVELQNAIEIVKRGGIDE